MKKLGLLSVILATAGLFACAPTPIKGKPFGGGSLYSDVQFNTWATDNPVGAKQGEACATGILSLISTGDSSAITAAKKAGVSKIGSIDALHTNILGIFTKYCTIVTGE